MFSRFLARWWKVLLILVVTVVAYRGVIANGFVMDDHHTVTDNPSVRSLTEAGSWFTSPYAVSQDRDKTTYRPVAVASYALDHALWGEGPAGFHATNPQAERRLRPAVITRQTNGCHRTARGALAHSLLASVLVTGRQQGVSLLVAFVKLQRATHINLRTLGVCPPPAS